MRDWISLCWRIIYLQERSFTDEDLLMDDGFRRRFLLCLCLSLAATFVCEMIRRRTKLGMADTKRFISAPGRGKFGYTRWQRERFDDMSYEELNKAAVGYDKQHPFTA